MGLPQEDLGVHTLVRRWVHERPDAAAVSDPATGVTVSYRELWERSGLLARELAAQGMGHGDTVAISHGRSIELVVAMLGIVRAGAAYLPLDAHAPPDRIAAMLAEAEISVVVGPDFDVTPEDGPAPIVSVGGEDPCFVLYTSGSTGKPKGVIIPHRAVIRLVTRSHHCVVAPGDRVASVSNPAFDAITVEVWGALAAGGTVVIMPSVLDLPIDDWVSLVRQERIDTLLITTSLFHTVAAERPEAFGSLATLIVGGEHLGIAAVRQVLAAGPPRRLVNGYGPTETATHASYFDCTESSLAGLDRVPVGFPVQDTTLFILDEDMRPLPPGQTGELCVGGPGVALGYLKRPDLTAERFVTMPDGARLYRTGDLARQLRSGAIDLVGRRDRQVKLRGFRIELEEIERTAMATNLCTAIFVEKVGEGPTAYLAGFVLPAPGTSIDTVSAKLAERLPGYMIPARWVLLDELRTGPTGKADRSHLLALLDQSAPVASVRTGPIDEAVQAIWQEVLDVPRVVPDDNFLDLGGNSLTAVQIAARIRQRLDIAVEPAEILLADSLADFTRRLPELITEGDK
ncbi:amino acid adenylation protein [Kibdelosporangium aridum]|uniref:Amino acid adenylation protein n=1 Tax=Kibdelosporangium aridum TaxID=2030 RepID=A0A428ZU87_KIBAR|nr:non-ribosomal peptide synthetase [Kibdelosporangium aridum]RSM91587.1 amino acid adenylation protein [Kibdelosporangium aridum]